MSHRRATSRPRRAPRAPPPAPFAPAAKFEPGRRRALAPSGRGVPGPRAEGGPLDFILDCPRPAPPPAAGPAVTVGSPFRILTIWQGHGSWRGPWNARDPARRPVDTRESKQPGVLAPRVAARVSPEGPGRWPRLVAQCRAELRDRRRERGLLKAGGSEGGMRSVKGRPGKPLISSLTPISACLFGM